VGGIVLNDTNIIQSLRGLRKFKPYSAYKDAEVEWLGDIPAHWELKKIRRITQSHKQGFYTEQAYIDDGVKLARITDIDDFGRVSFDEMPFVEIPAREERLFNLEKGDVLFARSGTIGRFGIVRKPDRSVFASYLIRFRFESVESEFLLFALGSQFFKESLLSTLHGGANQNVHAENIKEQLIALPPTFEQRAIAAFLDRETVKIDALVEKKERLIDLLQEKRATLITRAVTKGLDPNVPMKDSGVEWLAAIPAHWKVTRLRYGCSLLRDGTHQPPSRVVDGYPLLSVRNIIDGKLTRLPDDSMISEADFRLLERSFALQENDVLLAVVGATLGKVAIVGPMEPFTIQRSLAVLRPRPKLLKHPYLAHFLESRPFQSMLWKNTGFSAQPGIYLGTLGSFQVPVPPIEEQSQIVEALRLGVAQLDGLIDHVHDAIERLWELRIALISATASIGTPFVQALIGTPFSG
jgi:type I restriction enzyme S subunit